MKHRRYLIVVLALSTVAMVASVAWAGEQVNGVGQTHRSAAFGFVAMADRSGELTYNSNSGAFDVHCKRYSSYESGETAKGYPKVTVTARKCFRRSDGAQRFLLGVFIDRGEPGIAVDIARLWWSREWPVTPASATREDVGRIDSGNIQILAG